MFVHDALLSRLGISRLRRPSSSSSWNRAIIGSHYFKGSLDFMPPSRMMPLRRGGGCGASMSSSGQVCASPHVCPAGCRGLRGVFSKKVLSSSRSSSQSLSSLEPSSSPSCRSETFCRLTHRNQSFVNCQRTHRRDSRLLAVGDNGTAPLSRGGGGGVGAASTTTSTEVVDDDDFDDDDDEDDDDEFREEEDRARRRRAYDASPSTSAQASEVPQLPRTPREAVEQARESVQRALDDGVTRQTVQILLPVNQRRKDYSKTCLDEVNFNPDSALEEYRVAELMTGALLQGITWARDWTNKSPGAAASSEDDDEDEEADDEEEADEPQPPQQQQQQQQSQSGPPRIYGRRIDDGGGLSDPVGLLNVVGGGASAVVFPTADTLGELRRLDEVYKTMGQPLLLVCPQWIMEGKLVSDFGFGPWRRRAERFLDKFALTYRLVERRVWPKDGKTGDDVGGPGLLMSSSSRSASSVVRILTTYPNTHTAYLVAGPGANSVGEAPKLLGTWKGAAPSTAEIDALANMARSSAATAAVANAAAMASVVTPVTTLGDKETIDSAVLGSMDEESIRGLSARAEACAATERVEQFLRTPSGRPFDEAEFAALSKAALRAALAAYGKPFSGKVEQLRERLRGAQWQAEARKLREENAALSRRVASLEKELEKKERASEKIKEGDEEMCADFLTLLGVGCEYNRFGRPRATAVQLRQGLAKVGAQDRVGSQDKRATLVATLLRCAAEGAYQLPSGQASAAVVQDAEVKDSGISATKARPIGSVIGVYPESPGPLVNPDAANGENSEKSTSTSLAMQLPNPLALDSPLAWAASDAAREEKMRGLSRKSKQSKGKMSDAEREKRRQAALRRKKMGLRLGPKPGTVYRCSLCGEKGHRRSYCQYKPMLDLTIEELRAQAGAEGVDLPDEHTHDDVRILSSVDASSMDVDDLDLESDLNPKSRPQKLSKEDYIKLIVSARNAKSEELS